MIVEQHSIFGLQYTYVQTRIQRVIIDAFVLRSLEESSLETQNLVLIFNAVSAGMFRIRFIFYQS